MRRLLILLAAVPVIALAKAPTSEVERVAARPLPVAPTTSDGRVVCTAVVTLSAKGGADDVGVAAGRDCEGPWAKATRQAVSKWRWPDGAAGEKGHVTVMFDGTKAVNDKVEDVAGLGVIAQTTPTYPPAAVDHALGDVVCRAMVGVTSEGDPAVVAVDACPSEFQQAAALAVLGWRFQTRSASTIGRTWVLVKFHGK